MIAITVHPWHALGLARSETVMRWRDVCSGSRAGFERRHPGIMANWPFAHEYEMTYRLRWWCALGVLNA